MRALKILTSNQIREADAHTIQSHAIASIDLMERAAEACVDWIVKQFPTSAIKQQTINVFCGSGNNGGDGLAIARMLSEIDYQVEVFIIRHSERYSSDFKINEQRLTGLSNIKIHNISAASEINCARFNRETILIDALLGSGINKPVEGLLAEVIREINKTQLKVISIDVPSGLFSEDNTAVKDAVIAASHTLCFECPRLSFMFPDSGKYVNQFSILDIGLDKEFIAGLTAQNLFVIRDTVRNMLKRRTKFSHKGTYGHALIVAGSYGKIGAAILSSTACLKAGAGLLTVHVPRCGYDALQTALPEAMLDVDQHDHYLTDSIDIAKYDAIGIGPGLGTEKQTQNILKLLIQNAHVPLVLDADAISILGENKTWISFLPPGSILTPHPKEFERLAGKTSSDYERYLLQKSFSIKYQVYVVLKTAHTSISSPTGQVYFNSTGNPGMATAGSGDALTGIITGLLAQGYSSEQACILGVYLHGLAGDIAESFVSQESMIAGDIIKFLGDAFIELKQV